MRLTDYLSSPERKRIVADACHVTMPAVTHWSNGQRFPDPRYWRAIEAATKGEVTVDELLTEQTDGPAPTRRRAA